MSFIAGIVSLTDRPLSELRAPDPASLLTAESVALANRFDDPYASVVQVDFGGFAEPGFFRDDGGIVALAGHPLLPGDRMGASQDGCRGARTIRQHDVGAVGRLLATSTGAWAAAMYDSRSRTLTLCSDRAGARPLYWWTDGGVAVFASTMAYLEKHPLVPRVLDLQAVLERVTLRYSLADRTEFLDVKRVLAAEIISLGPHGALRTHYYRWADLPERPPKDASLEIEVVDLLRDAVDRRNGDRREAVTLLSGGMDSRVVNALLHEMGVSINSFNFSVPGTQDAVFSAQFAAEIGANHYAGLPVPGTGPGWVHKSGRVWDTHVSRSGVPLRDLFPIWSGDYGGIAAGWAGITPAIAAAMRKGRPRDAIELYLETRGIVPLKDVVPAARSWFATAVPDAMAHELARYESTDPARQFMFFLVGNGKRRDMDRFYEDILEHRTEFWTPFIDGRFLDACLTVAADDGMLHGFYARWFERLPAFVRAVPWQTYPGHVPCPLPIPPGLMTQWSAEGRAARSALGRSASRFPWGALLGNFPRGVFVRHRFVARAALHHARIRSSRRPLKTLRYFAEWWDRAEEHPLPWNGRSE